MHGLIFHCTPAGPQDTECLAHTAGSTVYSCVIVWPQVTTLLSHVEEVGKAQLPEPAELDTLRTNVAKQQQKVDQLSASQPPANGAPQVCHCPSD